MSAVTCPSCQQPVAVTPDGPTKCPYCGEAFPVFAGPTAPRTQTKPVSRPPDPLMPPGDSQDVPFLKPGPIPAPSKPTLPAPPQPPTEGSTGRRFRSAPEPTPAEHSHPRPPSPPSPVPSSKPVKRSRRSVTVEVPSGAAIMGLLDFKFEKYLTPVIVKITWVVTLIMLGIWVLVLTFGLFADFFPDGGGRSQQTTSSNVSFDGFEQQMQRAYRNRGTIISLVRFMTWVTCIVSAIITCLWIRVGLECVIVFFNISNTLTDIKRDLNSSSDR